MAGNPSNLRFTALFNRPWCSQRKNPFRSFSWLWDVLKAVSSIRIPNADALSILAVGVLQIALVNSLQIRKRLDSAWVQQNASSRGYWHQILVCLTRWLTWPDRVGNEISGSLSVEGSPTAIAALTLILGQMEREWALAFFVLPPNPWFQRFVYRKSNLIWLIIAL